MPPLPSVPGVLRISLIWTLGADTNCESRFYMAYTGTPPTAAQLNTFASAIATAYGSDLKAFAAATVVTLTGVKVTDLTSPTAAEGSATAAIVGTGGTYIGAGTATLMNFAINRRYRGGKPRVYLPFGYDGVLNTPNTWTSGFISGLETDWAAFIVALEAAPPGSATLTGQVNVSYYEGFTNFTGPTGRIRARSTVRSSPLVDVVTAISVNAKIASQRRRNLH